MNLVIWFKNCDVFNFEKLAQDIRTAFLLSLGLVELLNFSETSKFYCDACRRDEIWKRQYILRFGAQFTPLPPNVRKTKVIALNDLPQLAHPSVDFQPITCPERTVVAIEIEKTYEEMKRAADAHKISGSWCDFFAKTYKEHYVQKKSREQPIMMKMVYDPLNPRPHPTRTIYDDKLVLQHEVGKFFEIDFSLSENVIHYK